MKRIILLEDLEPDQKEMARYKELRELYNSNPELKKRADQIHSQRLISGDACHGCIELAIKALEKDNINPEWEKAEYDIEFGNFNFPQTLDLLQKKNEQT